MDCDQKYYCCDMMDFFLHEEKIAIGLVDNNIVIGSPILWGYYIDFKDSLECRKTEHCPWCGNLLIKDSYESY